MEVFHRQFVDVLTALSNLQTYSGELTPIIMRVGRKVLPQLAFKVFKQFPLLLERNTWDHNYMVEWLP